YRVDLGRVGPRVGQRLGTGGDGHVDQPLVLAREPPLDDADAVADPLVAGVHVLGELVVGHGAVGLGASHAEHARGGRALAELQSGHALGSKSPRLSGVFRANVVVTVPLSSRRTSPVSVPAGGSSAVAVTPR